MSSTLLRFMHWRLYYFLVPVACAAGILIAGWWSIQEISQEEAKRLQSIQLRILGTARDRIKDHLDQQEFKLKVLAEDIAKSAVGAAPTLSDQTVISLVSEGLQLRYYDAEGAIADERPSPGVYPRLPESEKKELLDWATEPNNADSSRVDLVGALFGSKADTSGVIRYSVPVWSNPDEGPSEPRGFLQFHFSGTELFNRYLIPTRPLPGSYPFVVSWKKTISDQASPPSLLWHLDEQQWVGVRGSTANVLRELGEQTTIFEAEAKDWGIVNVPQSDGRNREEILAHVPLVLGAQPTRPWVLCLSTPLEVAIGPSEEPRMFMVLLTVLALGILAVGVVLLMYQRRQLKEIDHNYRALFAENPTAMFVLDDESKLLDCNYSAERLIGSARQESIGTSFTAIFEPETVESLWEALRKRGNLHVRDCRIVRQYDQTALLVEFWGRQIDDHWILMAHDVERRRDLEQQIARLKRMDSVGSLASILAHDFNNILGQVQILVSNLRSDAEPESNFHEDLSAIEEKVDDASQIVGSLLSSREIVMSTEPVLLEPLLREFVAGERKVLRENIELKLDTRSGLPAVWIAPAALRRVLSNLFLNACDAMPYGGSLAVRAYGQEIDADQTADQLPPDHYAVIDVTDTGVGMSPEVLDTIFEPYFTTKAEGNGTGLGLWTVYRTIRGAGGWVHVRSRRRKGSSFTIYLPSRRPNFDRIAAAPGS